jgi:hypothetical protein
MHSPILEHIRMKEKVVIFGDFLCFLEMKKAESE